MKAFHNMTDTPNKLTIDQKALDVILSKLVDPWHKTFAKDVVEMYEANRKKQSEYDTHEGIPKHLRDFAKRYVVYEEDLPSKQSGVIYSKDLQSHIISKDEWNTSAKQSEDNDPILAMAVTCLSCGKRHDVCNCRTKAPETEQEKNGRLNAKIDAMPLNVHPTKQSVSGKWKHSALLDQDVFVPDELPEQQPKTPEME